MISFDVKIRLGFNLMGLLLFYRMGKKLTVMKIGTYKRIQILIQMKTLDMKRRA